MAKKRNTSANQGWAFQAKVLVDIRWNYLAILQISEPSAPFLEPTRLSN